MVNVRGDVTEVDLLLVVVDRRCCAGGSGGSSSLGRGWENETCDSTRRGA
jgi:hypothetical protein